MTTLGALPMYVAVPISLIGTCFSSVGSFIGYMLNGYWPDLWLGISIIIGGFAGGMLGSRAQKIFSEITLKCWEAVHRKFSVKLLLSGYLQLPCSSCSSVSSRSRSGYKA